ncbi:hypothetical protein EIN_234670, partial [Entamoeba invadens IP1]
MLRLEMSKTALQSLKKSPVFCYESSAIWFVKHFTPDTFDFANRVMPVIQITDNVKILRFPNFLYDFSINIFDVKLLPDILPKITSFYFGGSNIFPINFRPKLIDNLIDNSQHFVHLKKLEGDIEIITNFIKRYTENGLKKEGPLKQIVLWSHKDQYIKLSKETFGFLFDIQKCLVPNKTNVYVICDFFEENLCFDDFKDLVKKFKNFKFYFKVIYDDKNPFFNTNNVFIENGIIAFRGQVCSQTMTKIVEKSAATKVIHVSFVPSPTSWKLPPNVTEYILTQSDYVKKTFFDFTDDVSNVIRMKIDNSRGVDFSNNFNKLEVLIIEKSSRITFYEECTFPNLVELYIKWDTLL